MEHNKNNNFKQTISVSPVFRFPMQTTFCLNMEFQIEILNLIQLITEKRTYARYWSCSNHQFRFINVHFFSIWLSIGCPSTRVFFGSPIPCIVLESIFSSLGCLICLFVSFCEDPVLLFIDIISFIISFLQKNAKLPHCAFYVFRFFLHLH